MTRQVTDQLYIDLGYFTPEEYYVYIAQAGESSLIIGPNQDPADAGTSFTLTADVEVLKIPLEGSAELTSIIGLSVAVTKIIATDADLQTTSTQTLSAQRVRFANAALDVEIQSTSTAQRFRSSAVSMSVTVNNTATISHIQGADLFAFSSSQILLEISVIKDNNIALSTQFSIPTTFLSLIKRSAVPLSVQAQTSVVVIRSRRFQIQSQAAFSLTALGGRLIQFGDTLLIPSRTAKTLNLLGVSASTVEKRFGAQSALFSDTPRQTGPQGAIRIASNSDFGYTGNFTIEFWVYPTNNNDSILWDHIQDTFSTHFSIRRINYGGGSSSPLLVFTFPTLDRIVHGHQFAANNWHHVALTRSGTTYRLYLNGAKASSDWIDSSSLANPAPTGIGLASSVLNTGFAGYMDDIRVVNGTALYTTNNPGPPQQTLTDISGTVLLLNFETPGAFSDKVSLIPSLIPQVYAATTSATTSALKVKLFAASLTASTAVSTTAMRRRGVTVTATVNAGLTAAVLKLKTVDIVAENFAQVTAVATVNSTATAAPTATTSLNLNFTRIREITGLSLDRTPKTVTRVGNTFLDTSQSVFGAASARFDGVNDRLDIPTSTDFAFGGDAWTIEFWYRSFNLAGGRSIIDWRTTSSQNTPWIYADDGEITVRVGGVDRMSWSTALNNNQWYHIAVTRTGTLHRLFVDGVQRSSWTATVNYVQGGTVRIGERFDGLNDFNGWLDDVRIVRGSAVYTANFTAPTSQLAPISGTVLLLNMNIETNNTTFFDTVNLTQTTEIISSTANVTATVDKVLTASAQFNSTAQVNAVVNKIINFDAVLTAETQQSVDAFKIKILDSVEFTANTALSATVDRLVGSITSLLAFDSALTTEPVKVTDTDADLVSQATVTAVANFNTAPTLDLGVAFDSQVLARVSVDPGADLDSQATVTVLANAQQRITATLNSNFALTVLGGRSISLERNFNTGLGLDGVRIDPRPPYNGPFFITPNLVNSVWYRLDPTDTNRLLIAHGTAGDTSPGISITVRNRTTLRWRRFVGVGFTPEFYDIQWLNALPNDNEWHHLQLNYLTANADGGGLVTIQAFLDGESLGTRSANISQVSNTLGPYLTVRRNTAQIFTGQLTASQTVSSLFFPYRDLQPTVESLGNKTWYYNSLDAQDNATVTLVPPGAIVPFVGSSQPLMTQTAQAAFNVNAALVGVTTFIIMLPPAEFAVTATLGGPQRAAAELSLTTALSATATDFTKATADLSATTALTADIDRITGPVSADLTATANLTVEAYEFTKATADLAASAELAVLAGVSVAAQADLVSEFTLAIEPATSVIVVADLDSEFDITVTVTRIQTAEIALDSALDFSLDIVRIQPGLADLETTAELSLEITKTAGPVSAELFSEFTVDCDFTVVGKVEAQIFSDTLLDCTVERIRTGVSQFDALIDLEVAESRLRSTVIDITALASQLTIVRTLILSDRTTLIILPETRNLSVLSESRIWHIEPESRTRKILPEPRNIDIEQETRTINIKETS
jgi:hypothetical protein